MRDIVLVRLFNILIRQHVISVRVRAKNRLKNASEKRCNEFRFGTDFRVNLLLIKTIYFFLSEAGIFNAMIVSMEIIIKVCV
ncbi:hypothetical protein TN98_18310 [Pantoea anthophila]|nr:hypothetical protein TN98_18310 [Pantoea anthophila]